MIMPVYQKRGKFYCVYLDGKRRVWEPFGDGPQAKAQAEARDLEIKLKKKRGQWYQNPRLSIDFHTLTQIYLDTVGPTLSESTRDGIFRALSNYALPLIGPKPIADINMNDWHQIQDGMLKAGLKHRTINTYFAYLSRVFTWAIDENQPPYLEDHPWRKRVRLKERDNFKVDLLTLEEFFAIRSAAAPHLAWAMDVAYYTGVRPGPAELLSMKWTDVDWKNSRVQVFSPKTSTYHLQYLPPAFMNEMQKQREATHKDHPKCPYVVSFQGQKVRSLKTAWKHAKERAGITRRIRLYDIRHLHITYALALGAPITELAERVGHTNTKMIVNVYAHLAKDLQSKQAFKLPDIYRD